GLLPEEVGHADFVFQLLVSVCEKRQFQRKGKPLLIFVKQRKEWIFRKTLQYQFGFVFMRQPRRQRCFAAADIPFNNDIIVLEVAHGDSYFFTSSVSGVSLRSSSTLFFSTG